MGLHIATCSISSFRVSTKKIYRRGSHHENSQAIIRFVILRIFTSPCQLIYRSLYLQAPSTPTRQYSHPRQNTPPGSSSSSYTQVHLRHYSHPTQAHTLRLPTPDTPSTISSAHPPPACSACSCAPKSHCTSGTHQTCGQAGPGRRSGGRMSLSMFRGRRRTWKWCPGLRGCMRCGRRRE